MIALRPSRTKSDPRLEGLILEALGWAHDSWAALFVVGCPQMPTVIAVVKVVEVLAVVVVTAYVSLEVEVIFGNVNFAGMVTVGGEACGCEDVIDDTARGFFR